MTKWSFLTSNFTATKRLVPAALSLSIALSATSAFATTPTAISGSTTASAPAKEPLFSSSGALFQVVPQVADRKPLTDLDVTLDLNLHKTERTSTIFEIELEATKSWTDNPETSKAQLVTNQYYFQQTYQTDDADTSVTYGLTAALPANDGDREAGLENAVGGDLSLATKLGGVGVLLAVEPLFYNYKYDTASALGDEYNNKSSVLYLAKAKIPLSKQFAWRWKAYIFQYTNFADNTYNTGSLSTNFLWKPTPAFGAYLGYSSKNRMDKVVSSQKQLSREMVNVIVGMEWSI